ncbi:ABC transporter substrate-binding protein [Frankia sp. CNm7]|uniref:ABC transporter substrate-binding protein n=1 Tax=Frankia nepalensis TaxID=1836974 RepID=A0A937RFL1_9ACTN|nr:ABC transporter substrate-binding protein [Frankia nepalensis]MBL7499835.1 ABC transporter substrate-binding protein [Frankia nepalensis]MBL7514238.1 ABC transporter substrate-binding protein [Frankia nepalensis]MBL7519724.1 ABC transporter substrate-binding protein [Frankia nepalensis]MBL7631263.1 ABC transporter substrate-binding protein [Frankia nepalensis]
MAILRRFGPRARHRSAVTAFTIAGVVALAACGGGGEPASSGAAAAGAPKTGGTLKVSFFPDNPTFSCIDPFQVYWIEHRTIIRNFADSLTDQDPETGKIVPWLAQSWEISADGLTYTFKLRDGVTFSNGKKLDAQAVADNAQGWIDTVKATNGAAFGASYIQGLTGATVVDPLTVQLTLSQPNSSFLQATSTTNLAITDPANFARDPKTRCTGEGVVGSGQFVLDHYTPKVETVLTKRPTPYSWPSELVENSGDAYLDKVVFNYVGEDSVRTGNLVSGAIDISWPRNPFTVQDTTLIERSGHAVEKRPLPGVAYTHFANTSPGRPLADPEVRKALYKAIDLKSYAATIFGPEYPVVGGVFNSTTPYYEDQSAKLAYDPEGAKKILDAAGWTVGEGGFRFKDGKQLLLDYPITQFSAGPELVQAQLKVVGINLSLRPLTPAEQTTYLPQGNYDLTSTYFTRANPGALQFIINPEVANSKALATRSASPEAIADTQALFAQALRTTDEAQITKAYADLQEYLIDEGISFPLFERVQTAGVSSHVHGFAFTSESFLRLNDVWKDNS